MNPLKYYAMSTDLFVFIWIILTFVVAVYGGQRRIGGITTFFISLILSPVLGYIIALISGPSENRIY